MTVTKAFSADEPYHRIATRIRSSRKSGVRKITTQEPIGRRPNARRVAGRGSKRVSLDQRSQEWPRKASLGGIVDSVETYDVPTNGKTSNRLDGLKLSNGSQTPVAINGSSTHVAEKEAIAHPEHSRLYTLVGGNPTSTELEALDAFFALLATEAKNHNGIALERGALNAWGLPSQQFHSVQPFAPRAYRNQHITYGTS